MVEIIPYTEDDEDESNWIPLAAASSSASPNDATPHHHPASTAAAAAAPPNDEAAFVEFAARRRTGAVVSDSDGAMVVGHSGREGGSGGKWRREGVSFDERAGVGDDEGEWRGPSSPTPNATRFRTSDHQSGSWSLGKRLLIAHLASTATTASVTEADDDDESESGENIAWRRADELDGVGNGGYSSIVDEERDGEKLSTARRAPRESSDDDESESGENVAWRGADELDDVSNKGYSRIVDEERDGEKMSATRRAPREPLSDDDESEGEEDIPWRGADDLGIDDDDDDGGRPRRSADESREEGREGRRRRDDRDRARTDASSAGSRLRRTFVEDPLRSLPLCFLRHLYLETRVQLAAAWDSYSERNELHGVLAPLALFVIVALLGVGLVGSGLFGLSSFAFRASSQVASSLRAWTVESAWPMAGKMARTSACVSFVLGIIAWICSRFNGRGEEATDRKEGETAFDSFGAPSMSALIPWAVAFTSPSLYEFVVIILSLRTCLSVMTTEYYHMEECVSLPDDDGNISCLADDTLDSSSPSSGMSSLAICALTISVAAANAVVVAVVANRTLVSEEDTSDGEGGSKERLSTGSTEGMSTGSTHAFVESYNRIRRHSCTYHTVSVLSLAVTSSCALFVQTLHVHSIGKALFGLGTVGRDMLLVGLGIFVLITLRDVAIAAVAGDDSILAGRISRREILSKALKGSIAEVSASALGAGDDWLLRAAVLEWAVDRWAASRAPSEDARGESQSRDGFSSPPATNDNANDDYDGPDCGGFPGSNRAGSRSNDFQGRDFEGREGNNFQGHEGNNFQGHEGNNFQGHEENGNSGSSGDADTDEHQSTLPSYRSLQNVISKLDADATLIPAIERYRARVYSLFPSSRNAALCVALWKMCPATTVLGLAVPWCICSSVVGGMLSFFSWSVCASSPIATATAENGHGWTLSFFVAIAILSPLLFLEYQRVTVWWERTAIRLKNTNRGERPSSELARRDLVTILMQADAADDSRYRSALYADSFVDTSSLLRRAWLLLLESIAVLESSIPAVRVATVASAAADLTGDTVCLADFALEVRRRGPFGGALMFLSDAFRYHLSKELEKRRREAAADGSREGRRAEDDDGDLGGRYTGAMASAVENLGRMSRNVSRLMESRSELEGGDRSSGDDDDGGETRVESNENGGTEDGSSDGGDDKGADVESNEDGGTERTNRDVVERPSRVEDESNENGETEDGSNRRADGGTANVESDEDEGMARTNRVDERPYRAVDRQETIRTAEDRIEEEPVENGKEEGSDDDVRPEEGAVSPARPKEADGGNAKVESDEGEGTARTNEAEERPNRAVDRRETFRTAQDRIEEEPVENGKGEGSTDDVRPEEGAAPPARPEEADLTTPRDDHGGGEDDVSPLDDGGEQRDDDNGLLPFLIGGGVALAGALAGIVAVHHASNNNNREEDERRKASSSKDPS